MTVLHMMVLDDGDVIYRNLTWRNLPVGVVVVS
jgi:hypothetical protein